jgi:glycosyltransferase involved in cell wall biosynthesis
MLSILIPTYNYKVTKLVSDLHQQATDLGIDFEIIVMEDGSVKFVDENAVILHLKNCRHVLLQDNIGRSAIRNKLADEAKYEHLLFLDCDAVIKNDDFLYKYQAFSKEPCVVLGGRIYDEKNTDPQYSLLRKYGAEKERNDLKNLKYRHKYPTFTTPNFLISKSLFNKVRFDESIVGYGHEDTIFGVRLQELNINFNFIDNPVVHVGLEPNNVFLKKTEESVLRLYELYQSEKYASLTKNSKLLHIFSQLKKFHLVSLFAFKYFIIKPLIISHLNSKHPSLMIYDMYKLLLLCKYDVSADKMTVK